MRMSGTVFAGACWKIIYSVTDDGKIRMGKFPTYDFIHLLLLVSGEAMEARVDIVYRLFTKGR